MATIKQTSELIYQMQLYPLKKQIYTSASCEEKQGLMYWLTHKRSITCKTSHITNTSITSTLYCISWNLSNITNVIWCFS